MSSQPLVSILIPAYNAQDWIGDTIQSALAQTWPRKEIIVVDDGSKDGTLEVARRFASATVKVISKPNEGAAATRNLAYSHSQGDFIQWLDADDLLSPDKVELQVEAALRAGSRRVLLSSGWVYFHYRTRHLSIEPSSLWHDLAPAEWLERKLSQNLHMQTATWLTSRELSDAAGAWDTRLLSDDDGEYFCRVLLASEGVKFVPRAMTYYRMAGFGSLGNVGISKPKLEALLIAMRLHIKYFLSLSDTPRTRAACLTYIDNWHIHFLPDNFGLEPQLKQMAADLGGALSDPKLPWKYDWLRRIWGWKVARKAQIMLPRIKWAGIIRWDKLLFRLERGLSPGQRV